MIEIPRAALTSAEIAKYAEFFSFGTNDLTQTTYGLSRDDSGMFLKDYLDAKIFERDPFASLDQTGVGRLMQISIEEGRAARAASPTQSRHLRRARRRSGLGRILPSHRPGLRQLLSVPRADRASGRGAGGDSESARDEAPALGPEKGRGQTTANEALVS